MVIAYPTLSLPVFYVLAAAVFSSLASGKPIQKGSNVDRFANVPCTASNAGAWACIPDRAECYNNAWHNVPCEPNTVCQGGLCVFSPSGAPSTTATTASTSTSTTTSHGTKTKTISTSTSTSTSSGTSTKSTSSSTSAPSPTKGPPPPPPKGGSKFVIYIDATGGSSAGAVFAVPGDVSKNAYNIINLAFWQSYGPWDSANMWSTLDASTRQQYLDAYQKAGVSVLVSAFGAAEWPTTSGVDPIKAANDLAAFVKSNGLHGVDCDYEDNSAMNAGTGEKWLIDFTKQLRKQLPKPYIISHAPQAPYFIKNKQQYPNGAYLAVDAAVGDLIDFYNVQFYNQGSSSYDTCQTLLQSSGGSFPGTSLFEISANGIPLQKLVIGKPVTQAGASNTGYMPVDQLASCLTEAKKKGWSGGAMGWQFSLDKDGSWINKLASAMK